MPESPIGQFMNCADGNRRARIAVLFGNNPLGQQGVAITAKTADYTIKSEEIGCAFSNESATGAVIFTLPKPFAGALLHVFKEAAQNVTLAAAGGTTVNGGASIANTASEAASAVITLVGVSATKWKVYNKQGTWA